jgi:hypothetical protein
MRRIKRPWLAEEMVQKLEERRNWIKVNSFLDKRKYNELRKVTN